jgi:hypothetical protein
MRVVDFVEVNNEAEVAREVERVARSVKEMLFPSSAASAGSTEKSSYARFTST